MTDTFTRTELNPIKLAEMLEELENTVELHSMSVRYKGETVLEGAWAPFSLNDPQMMHSLSKIGTSICVGFAVDEGKLHLEKVISAVYDRGEGKGAKINVDIIAKDEAGDPVFTNTMGYLNRWAGGFGGPKVPHSTVVIPEREADYEIKDAYPENAPLLYRLTGDTYPLHADPAFAKKAGFDRPIVHGLCSLGYACRMMIDALFPGEPERMVSIENQFRAVALPGDHFTLHVWKTGENEALFRMVKDSDGKAILDYGRMTWK